MEKRPVAEKSGEEKCYVQILIRKLKFENILFTMKRTSF